MSEDLRKSVLVPLILVGLSATAWLAWQLRFELILIFASALFGMSLFVSARWLSARTGLPHRGAVVTWYLTGILLAAGFVAFAGQRLTDSYGELGSRIPQALRTLESRLEGKPFLGTMGQQVRDFRRRMTEDGQQTNGESSEMQDEATSQQMRIMEISARTLSAFIVWAVLSFFIAFDGRLYMRATLKLFPPDKRHVGEDLLSSLTSALPWWLVGRLASMVAVVLLTTPGLLILGIPLPWILGIIAGLFSFVPFVGPVASVAPAALVTLEAAPDKLLWVFGLYALVQFLESNFITPKIQQRVASVPPLLLISGQFLMAALVGVVGVMFATPLMLAAMVTIQVLWIRHALHEDVSTPRESTVTS